MMFAIPSFRPTALEAAAHPALAALLASAALFFGASAVATPAAAVADAPSSGPPSATVQHGPDASRCSVERLQASAASTMRIDSVRHVAEDGGVPAHCAVTGWIDNGSRIGFSLGLPDTWNGKFLFYGVGGFAGVLQPIAPGLMRGYATATTDTGHRGTSLEDARWALNDRAAVVNHFEWGVERAAQATKGLMTAYYGALPAHSYFQGCSAGGRQALVEAERFPASFDGIVAEAPAWNYSTLLSTFLANGNTILQSPERWIAPQTFDEIDRTVLRQCDAADGVTDGIVMDPRRCQPNLQSLRCKPGDRSNQCLTPAQLQILDELQHPRFARHWPGAYGFRLSGSDQSVGYSWGWPEWFFGSLPPMRDATGRLNFRPNVATSPDERGRGPNQFILGEQFFRYMVMNDPSYDARSFEAGRDRGKLQQVLGDFLDADSTNLGRFVRGGGKLLIWHGWSDPAIPAEMSIDLYQRFQRDTARPPAAQSLDASVRLFMVPGMQHCGGGTGLTSFDALGALEQWAERQSAPDRIVAAQLVNGKPARTRPLCPYPKVAHYKGSGNPDVADNFECR